MLVEEGGWTLPAVGEETREIGNPVALANCSHCQGIKDSQSPCPGLVLSTLVPSIMVFCLRGQRTLPPDLPPPILSLVVADTWPK